MCCATGGRGCPRALHGATTRIAWLLPRRPGRTAEQLGLPPVAVLEPLHHPAGPLRALLPLREELGEARPVEDALEEHDLVLPPRAGRDGPARLDRDHA